MHCKNNFPLKKTKSDLDVPLEKGMQDNQYLETLQKHIEILKKKKVDLILFQAGVDILSKDRLGYLQISRNGVRKRNKMVLDFAKEKKYP